MSGKRLCVFYRLAKLWQGGQNVQWIVCKECQRKIERGLLPIIIDKMVKDYQRPYYVDHKT